MNDKRNNLNERDARIESQEPSSKKARKLEKCKLHSYVMDVGHIY